MYNFVKAVELYKQHSEMDIKVACDKLLKHLPKWIGEVECKINSKKIEITKNAGDLMKITGAKNIEDLKTIFSHVKRRLEASRRQICKSSRKSQVEPVETSTGCSDFETCDDGTTTNTDKREESNNNIGKINSIDEIKDKVRNVDKMTVPEVFFLEAKQGWGTKEIRIDIILEKGG